jgi:AAA+ superfamily predicted ATPase
MTATASSEALQGALRVMRARVAAAAGEPNEPSDAALPTASEPSTADDLATRFELSRFERDVLVLAALPVLESGAAELCARAQHDERRQLPSLAFALSLLPEAHWSAFAPSGPLRANELIVLGEDSVSSARGIALPERVLLHLVGLRGLDEALAENTTPLHDETTLVASHAALADTIAARVRASKPDAATSLLQVLGTGRQTMVGVVAAAAARAQRTAYLLDAETLPSHVGERARLARLWSREAQLADVLLVIDAHDIATPQELRGIGRFAAAITGPVILLAAEAVPLAYRAIERFELPRPTSEEQAALWRAQLGAMAEPMSTQIDRLASHFTASPAVVAEVAHVARREAPTQHDGSASSEQARERLEELLWRETRERVRPKLDELAHRIEGRVDWNSLVLPPRQLATLKAIEAQVRQRTKVYESWGFDARDGRGLGINALFAGPSGTGKTLAAEVLGAALGLDVYRIDLASVVSKWIGETEKNLKRVFDAAESTSAILLFDEADALFGKRSEVRESHDRYANIEVSYLLQRMETYRGLALLTTNLRSHLDQAFLRRLRFVVEFPFPGEAERRKIWVHAFPEEAKPDTLDFDRLAQLNVPGGSIKVIALNAAFIAAEAGVHVGMKHVRAAARAEYEKLGKALTDVELRGWKADAAHA